MPLSEREQKILQEIEKNLFHEDPSFARGVGRKRRFSEAMRARVGALVFLGGFIALIAFFLSRSVALGVIAFGAMVAGMVLLASSFKTFISTEGSQTRFSQVVKRWEERARNRYKRD